MNQKAEKIVNIEHADNINIDMSGLFESAEKLNKAIDRIPGLIEATIAMLASDRQMTPGSLKSKYENTCNVGDIVMSHWQIDKCIGKGSLSTVFEAHHTGSLYKSAIKVIHSSLNFFDIEPSDITHRVFDADAMIRMELNNMVELRGTGYIVEYEDHEAVENSDGSQDIIIRMELLKPLSAKTMAGKEVVRLGIDICKALDFCHKSNIIHCDVKPSNIYTTKWGGYKLGDFSASIKSGDHPGKNQIGTLKYMAPEVYQGKLLSPSIDFYSLGLVMYEMLGGNRTKSIRDREEALSKRLSGEPLPPIPGMGRRLQSIIQKACAFNPEERFSSAAEMLEELSKVKS